MVELPRCASCRVSVKPDQNVVFRPDGRVQHLACPDVVCPVCSGSIRPFDPIRRDGEALLHGNCWMKRQRNATKPPAKMEPVVDGIASVVRAKLTAGALPRMEVQRSWAGPGSGLPCSGCDQVITRQEVEHEIEVNRGSTLRFHRACFLAWQQEAERSGREIAGGSAASPWTLLFEAELGRRAARDRASYEEFRAAIAESWLAAADTRLRSRAVRAARRHLATRSALTI